MYALACTRSRDFLSPNSATAYQHPAEGYIRDRGCSKEVTFRALTSDGRPSCLQSSVFSYFRLEDFHRRHEIVCHAAPKKYCLVGFGKWYRDTGAICPYPIQRKRGTIPLPHPWSRVCFVHHRLARAPKVPSLPCSPCLRSSTFPFFFVWTKPNDGIPHTTNSSHDASIIIESPLLAMLCSS